jgi:hypothetical protein
MGSILYLEWNPVSAPGPSAQEVEQVPSAVVVASLLECTDHRPAVWSDVGVPQVQPAVAVAPVAPEPGGVRQGEAAKAFCLPARPGSRRCYHSPQTIP